MEFKILKSYFDKENNATLELKECTPLCVNTFYLVECNIKNETRYYSEDKAFGTYQEALEVFIDDLLEYLNPKEVLTEKYYTYGREGKVGKRKENEIGIHAVRGGNIVGGNRG